MLIFCDFRQGLKSYFCVFIFFLFNLSLDAQDTGITIEGEARIIDYSKQDKVTENPSLIDVNLLIVQGNASVITANLVKPAVATPSPRHLKEAVKAFAPLKKNLPRKLFRYRKQSILFMQTILFLVLGLSRCWGRRLLYSSLTKSFLGNLI